MQYKPITAVWEITFSCNMRCKHCGSSCTTTMPDELTEQEALSLCDQIGEMGLQYITLSGGEPLTRKDWHKIAKRLKQNNVTPNMITNGWFLTQEQIEQAKESGISNIAISLDGMKETHNFMRKQGSFERIEKALDLLKKLGMPSSIITTINNKNIKELPELYNFLKEKGVRNWQMQYAMPMGNFVENKELIIEPKQIDDIIDIAHKFAKENIIRIDLADCVGYYSPKEIEIRTFGHDTDIYFWQGCLAGKRVFGIRYNGDVVGCTSLRDDQFIEANIKEKRLKEIWDSELSFKWNRNLKKSDLSGFCSKCQYGNYCLAGCSVLKFTTGKKLIENNYCSYKVAIDYDEKCVRDIHDLNELVEKAKFAIENENYQFAEMCLTKALLKRPNDIHLINQLGYVNFKLENFQISLEFNGKALEIEPKNAYAHKGKGLCYAYLGEIDASVVNLQKAIELADDDFMDPYYDLALVLHRVGRNKEAEQVLIQGSQKSEEFAGFSAGLLGNIQENLN